MQLVIRPVDEVASAAAKARTAKKTAGRPADAPSPSLAGRVDGTLQLERASPAKRPSRQIDNSDSVGYHQAKPKPFLVSFGPGDLSLRDRLCFCGACCLHAKQAIQVLVLQHLIVAIHRRDGQEHARAAPDGPQQVGAHGEQADAHASKGRRSGDVAVQHVHERLVPIPLDGHPRVDEVLGHVAHAGAGHVDPHLGQQRTGHAHEHDVEHRPQRVVQRLLHAARRADIVRQPSHRDAVSAARRRLPATQQAHEEEARVAAVQQLADEVHVGHQRRLQDDGHVAGVEELDGEGARVAALARVGQRQVHLPALEEDDHEEHQDGGQEVHEVGQVAAEERLSQGPQLIGSREHHVEERDDGALELRAAPRVDRRGRQRLPHDALAGVGGDEEGDAATEAIPLLHQFIQQQHQDAGQEELQHNEDGVAGAQLRQRSVHAAHDIREGFAQRDDDAEELLCGVEQIPVFLHPVVNFNDPGAGHELHDERRRHDRRDTELHESAAVGRQQHTHPEERVRRVGRVHAVQGDLAAHQEDEQSHHRPERLLAEWNRSGRRLREQSRSAERERESHEESAFVSRLPLSPAAAGKVG
eukprot:scaffold180_cov311-Pinguiococcus_pyrenoidosus.AAC.22